MALSSSASERWKHLLQQAKDLSKREKYEESLAAYHEALKIAHSDKIVRRIKKLEVLQSALLCFVSLFTS